MAPISVARVRVEMARRGLNQAQLARLAGVDPSAISRALTRGEVRQPTLERIARALSETPIFDGAELVLEEAEVQKEVAP